MFIHRENLTIRNATMKDAALLSKWWNDGRIMAHAGFPNGTGETPEAIAQSLLTDTDQTRRRLIIEVENIPVGEMNFRNRDNNIAEIGIKICDFSQQEKGYGKQFLSILISALFKEFGFTKIILDTNLNNTRAQHVYEQLGFCKSRVNINAWTDQLGEMQTSVDYELTEEKFVNFAV